MVYVAHHIKHVFIFHISTQYQEHPSKHKTLVQHLYNGGARWADVVQMLYKCFVLTGICNKVDPHVIIVIIPCLKTLLPNQ